MNAVIQVHNAVIIRKLVLILRNMNPYQSVAGFFQFRRQHILQMGDVNRERYQRRRYIDIIEGS